MKPALRSLLLLSLATLSIKKANAQCTATDIVIQNVQQISSTPTSCTIKFDMTFNIESNSGNKFIFIHGWLEADYPDYFRCVNGQSTLNGSIAAPRSSDLGNPYFNIGLDNTGAIPVVLTTYSPDPSVTLSQMDSARKVVLPDGSANITLYGVVATSNTTCGTPEIIQVDLWSSQSASGQRAHCVNCGIRYAYGYLTAAGFVNCISLRYNGTITNRTNILIDGYYRVFADVNRDGYFTPTTDTLLQGNTPFSVGPFASLGISGPIPGANLNQNVFIVITQTTGNASGASIVYLFQSSQCSPLPVSFGQFSATRSSPNNVVLKWETLTEINNSGFFIERNMSNNTWDNVTFISSHSPGGNSTTINNYSFTDINTNKGITQYRIKQVDIDGKTKYSEIRAVRGNEQKDKTIVYPNPSTDGHVKIILADQEDKKDITITDMNGHTLQQWTGITNNTLQINNLRTGMYILRVINKKTRNQSVEKIIVIK